MFKIKITTSQGINYLYYSPGISNIKALINNVMKNENCPGIVRVIIRRIV